MYVFCAKIFVLCIFGLISVLFFLLCCAKMAHILSKISFLEKNQRTAIHSISTRAFLGRVFTATAERAGKGAEK